MTRRVGYIITAALLGLSSSARAQSTAEEILDKAIEAHGGASALEKVRLVKRQIAGTLIQRGNEITFTSEETTDLPDRLRLKVILGKEKTEVVVVVNATEGWMHTGGTTQPMTKASLEEQKEVGFAMYVSTLAPLKKDKGITMKVLPDEKVGGRPARAVKVSKKGHEDVTLLFDKASGLLVRMSHRTLLAGLKVDREYAFSDFQLYSGVRLPSKLEEMHNGRTYMTGKITSYSFPDKAEDKHFAKP